MAGRTARGNACMVHRRASEAGGRFMASLTRRSGWYMVSWFGQARTAYLMARCTVGGDASVIHRSTLKAGGRFMATFTGSGGSDVGAWFRNRLHSLEAATVMAGCATRGDASVVHGGAGKAGGRFMAGFACCCRRNMISRFSQACATYFMTGRTASANAGVIHRRTLEARGRFMTALAGSARYNVSAWFK